MWAWRAYATRRRSAKIQLRVADLLAGWLVLIWVWGSWRKGVETSLSPRLPQASMTVKTEGSPIRALASDDTLVSTVIRPRNE